MYLSKIILDVRHPSVRQALRDANDLHRNLMAGFDMDPEARTPRADRRVLFRLVARRDELVLLVTSAERPDVRALAARGFNTGDALIRDISALRDAFVPGRQLRFELLASPCKKQAGEGENSRRRFLETAEERAAWLARKGEQGGFQLVQAGEIGGRVDILGRRGGAEVKNSGVLFSGLLRVTDQEAFWKSYTEGVGPGKAYGLGMLTVARA